MGCSVGLKYAKNALAAGAPPRTSLVCSQRSPRPPSRLGRGTPLPIHHPLGASILAPSALRSSCPQWKPARLPLGGTRLSLVPPAALELATVLPFGKKIMEIVPGEPIRRGKWGVKRKRGSQI